MADNKKDILECRSNVIHYNKGQIEALEKIRDFLNTPDERFFLLAGYSGTGKTTIAENIVKYSNANVLAPTNTAVNRLRDKIVGSKADFGTIHSCLFSPKDDNGGFKKERSFEREKTYIIDEASMIDKFVLDTIIKDAIEKECKIIFLGDSFQLEPVGDDPFIFLWEKSYPEHFLEHNKYEMTEVTRYDGSLLKIATELRTTGKPEFVLPKDSDLALVNSFTKRLGECIDENNSYAVLTATNLERIKFNRMIRQFRYRKKYKDPKDLPDVILEGEKLISISNGNHYANGELFEEKEFELIGEALLNYYPMSKKKMSEDKDLFGKTKKLPPNRTIKFILYKKKTKGTSDFDRFFSSYNKFGGEYYLFSADIKEPSFHGATIVKSALKDSNMEIVCSEAIKKILFIPNPKTNTVYWNKNVTICTYGYAMSTHKSQGQEWNNVFISAPFLMKEWNHARWFYTAITRAKEKVQMIANPYLKIK
jgi:hypothetical protein